MTLERASALAVEHYTDPRWLDFELARIFSVCWQLIGHVSQLPEPGDHIVAEAGGAPVLAVRGEDGQLRAFANVCRHRAGPIATCNGKGAKRLRCRYHGWVYGLDGQLRLAPDMDGAAGFAPETLALPRLRLEVWQGLIFVAQPSAPACDPPVQAGPSLSGLTAGVAARIAPVDLASLSFVRRIVYTVEANWKTYVDNYLEGYHVPFVHPDLTQTLDYAGYVTELAQWHSLQYSPVRDTSGAYSASDMFYYFLWPNMMLNIVGERLQTNRVLPDGPNRCRVEFDYYYSAATMDRAEADISFTDQVQAEDAAICAAVQTGLASGFYAPGRLSPKREAGVWHFQQLLRSAYDHA